MSDFYTTASLSLPKVATSLQPIWFDKFIGEIWVMFRVRFEGQKTAPVCKNTSLEGRKALSLLGESGLESSSPTSNVISLAVRSSTVTWSWSGSLASAHLSPLSSQTSSKCLCWLLEIAWSETCQKRQACRDPEQHSGDTTRVGNRKRLRTNASPACLKSKSEGNGDVHSIRQVGWFPSRGCWLTGLDYCVILRGSLLSNQWNQSTRGLRSCSCNLKFKCTQLYTHIINTLDIYKYIYIYTCVCADHTQSSQLVSTMTAFHDAPAIWTQESQTWNTRGCWDLYGMCSSSITTEWDQSPSLELAESWGGINGIPFCPLYSVLCNINSSPDVKIIENPFDLEQSEQKNSGNYGKLVLGCYRTPSLHVPNRQCPVVLTDFRHFQSISGKTSARFSQQWIQ